MRAGVCGLALFVLPSSAHAIDWSLKLEPGMAAAAGAPQSRMFGPGWSVGTAATIGTTANLKGTILADQAISLNTGASLEGRALARIAAVTLLSNVITVPSP